MYKNIYIPQHYEGWTEIEMVFDRNLNREYYQDEYLFENKTDGLNYINQDNPHHTLTIGRHCLKVEEILKNESFILQYAGLYHDIGKKFTKSFENSKGDVTDVSHFYNHELVSAYESLFYLYNLDFSLNNLLEITKLITWHMRIYSIENEKIFPNGIKKATNKFINLVGKEFYDKLLLLHEADKLAK